MMQAGLNEDALYDQIVSLVGPPSLSIRTAPAPVSAAQIQRWVEAFGDESPIYIDERSAVSSGREGIVAPPAMLSAFTGRGLREVRGTIGKTGLSRVLEACGLVSPAVMISHAYEADIRPGDLVREASQVVSVSRRKTTKLGAGYFVTIRSDFTGKERMRFGTQRLTVFAFRPGGREINTDKDKGETLASRVLPSLEGEAIPPLSVTLDRLGVIACANACGDFNAGHYDPEVARAYGFRDIFTDSYTSLGFAHRFLTDWSRPTIRIMELSLRLGALLFAGDTLHLTGAVADRQSDPLHVELRGLCGTGLHIDGFAKLGPVAPETV